MRYINIFDGLVIEKLPSFQGKKPVMKLANQIRPISYLKSKAAEIIRNLDEYNSPLIITQNGEAKAVLQDIESYENTQRKLALLKILAMGELQVEEGRTKPLEETVRVLKSSLREEL